MLKFFHSIFYFVVYDLSGEETLSFVSNPDLLSFKLPKCDFNAVSKKKSSRESK